MYTRAVFVGFHDDGRLRRVMRLRTLEIPRMVRQKQYWDPAVCVNFAETLLRRLRDEYLTEDDAGQVYAVRYRPERQCTVTIGRVSVPPFLPDWFLAGREPPPPPPP